MNFSITYINASIIVALAITATDSVTNSDLIDISSNQKKPSKAYKRLSIFVVGSCVIAVYILELLILLLIIGFLE